MIKQLSKIIDNWFFVSLTGFAIVLPFSQALVSIFGGVVLFTALAEDNWSNKFKRFKENRILLFVPVIYGIYLLSAFLSATDINQSLYDLKKNLFFLVLPLAFLFGKNITAAQKRFLFYVFALAVFISTIVAVVHWMFLSGEVGFEVHKASLISHIRFSFQLILVFWFFVIFIQKNYKKTSGTALRFSVLAAAYFISFLLFQQSLTGIIALITSALFYIFYLIFQVSFKKRIILLILAVFIISLPVAYVSWIVIKFYTIEEVNRETIDLKTKHGNLYQHDFDNPVVENGRYVYLYISRKEAREEWNKLSEIKYDSIVNGYPLSATLIRYLTSKGLRKDAEGVKALNQQDIRNIENGMANVIYQKKKFSLYPRIYQTVWEYYIYSKTGFANHQSFSQRIEFAKAAITIIKQNLWFGVGTANWKEEFIKSYKANKSQLSEDLYASSHNQYLNYMVKFGVVGFLIIMFCLIFPVIKTKRYRDNLFLLFLVFLFFVNFADSNFESHMGGSFFVFFYCIFIITDGVKYLQLNKN